MALLTRMWDPLVNDWIAADTANRSATDLVATVFAYTGGKVTSVTSPAPDGATPALRPAEDVHLRRRATTLMDVRGLDSSGAPVGAHAGKVTFDTGWRATSSTTPLGLDIEHDMEPEGSEAVVHATPWG